MKILLADDHFLVLEGLEVLLSTFDFVKSTQSVINYMEMKEVLKHETFDVLLLDIHFGKHDGRVIITEIKKMMPAIKIIALTSHSDATTVKSSFNAGFDGYLLKIDNREEIEKALKAVSSNEKYFSSKTQQVFFENQVSKNKVALTEREKEILQLIVEEKTTKEIAEQLYLSEKTIETHRGNLMIKLDVKNIAGMVKKAIIQGLVNI
ncbi:MAG: response regulator transcription factor [Chitinophagales bacterium]|nr:response regulator transcription factor [Chitinophagales bacterium]HND96454.1 response regulator transcription factor [Chitinophagaceae bacterium]MCB9074456.1 response regulator transcription factor [Chitinophagales bacterium]HMU98817.1 response regulator transcription factor [Chitinophagales bacterium]HMW95035.1 response regulator transcription factor [Chitinophagales bacterium]